MPIPTSLLGTLLEQLVLDFDFLDLVLWFPNLTWPEFGASLGLLLAWKWVLDQVERIVSSHMRAWIGHRLLLVRGRLGV